MSLALERILYASTATGSTGSLLNMVAILAESQRNNERDGLTGALAAHDERFIQVLEGPGHTLDGLLRRLEGDPRHRDIVVLDRRPINGRQFGDWAMANAQFSPGKLEALARLTDSGGASADEIVRLMREAVAA
jgi:hypothetical protein